MDILIRLKEILLSVSWVDGVIMAISFLTLYAVFSFLKSNRAGLLIWLFALASIIVACILLLFHYDGRLILLLPIILILLVSSIFSVEIKRLLWSHKTETKKSEVKVSERQVEKSVNELIRAVQNMSKQDIGALMILASAPMPNSIMESGTYVNSEISAQLIESIFFPKTPLHDGAMVISGVNIVAAGCFLPLSQELSLPQELGTRHRAGIGITENIDVIAIIVSEESGIISIAQKGKLRRYIDNETLRLTFTDYYKNFYKNKELENERQ